MKYELHALASNLSLHNPVVKYTHSSSTGGCPQISPEQSEQLCAKLLVRSALTGVLGIRELLRGCCH